MARQVLTIPDVPPTLLQSATAAATYVAKAGDVMTGALSAPRLNVTGDNLTGGLLIKTVPPPAGDYGYSYLLRMDNRNEDLEMDVDFGSGPRMVYRFDADDSRFMVYDYALGPRYAYLSASLLMLQTTGTAATDFTAELRPDSLYFRRKSDGNSAQLSFTPPYGFTSWQNVGVGLDPGSWDTAWRALRVGGGLTLWSQASAGAAVSAYLSMNSTFTPGGSRKSIRAGRGNEFALEDGSYVFRSFADTGGAGVTQTITQLAQITNTGTLVVNPAAGQYGLSIPSSGVTEYRAIQMGTWWMRMYGNANSEYKLSIGRDFAPAGEYLQLDGVNRLNYIGGHWLPATDNAYYLGNSTNRWVAIAVSEVVNSNGHVILRTTGGAGNIYSAPVNGIHCPISHGNIYLGYSGLNWHSVWANNGTIQTSTVEAKEAFVTLDPVACAQAVLDTDWLSFSYLPPERPEGQDAEAHARQMEETAHTRRQRGYVLGSSEYRVSDLFGLADRRSKSNGSDLAVVACALQDALKRIAQLEGAAHLNGTNGHTTITQLEVSA